MRPVPAESKPHPFVYNHSLAAARPHYEDHQTMGSQCSLVSSLSSGKPTELKIHVEARIQHERAMRINFDACRTEMSVSNAGAAFGLRPHQ